MRSRSTVLCFPSKERLPVSVSTSKGKRLMISIARPICITLNCRCVDHALLLAPSASVRVSFRGGGFKRHMTVANANSRMGVCLGGKHLGTTRVSSVTLKRGTFFLGVSDVLGMGLRRLSRTKLSRRVGRVRGVHLGCFAYTALPSCPCFRVHVTGSSACRTSLRC